ncbi:hypothetical protein DRP05_10705 [Archaeoglobales archaeon]|nr:MAG: hypothetical protein DRP05_10705 [Archaeoglobales archaeon]
MYIIFVCIEKIYGEEGLTTDEISKLIGVSKGTVKKHLDILCSLQEVYSLRKDRKITLYFPNGKPLHTVGKIRLEWPIPGQIGHPIFEITVNLGPSNRKFLHILEKKYTLLDGETPEGAILVPFDYLDEFIDALKQMKDKFKEVEND